MSEHPSVLLVGMPFASAELPSLSLALLQAHLQQAGYRCDARWAYLDLAAELDRDVFQLASSGPLAGEWLFVPALYGSPLVANDAERYQAYARGVLGPALPDDLSARLLATRDRCTRFVDEVYRSIDWTDYDAIGFSVVFQQTLASLALATRIKADHPDLPILFGGASVHDEMGKALHECFDCIDIVCTGEADETVLDIFEAARGLRDPATVPGIVYRQDGKSMATPAAPPVTALDDLPHPVYDDWFHQREAAGLDEGQRIIMMETSRGCWWGAISHCTFCGLNGDTMSYRSKDGDRAYDEIVGLHERYDADFVVVVDNILDMRYLRTLLPRLAERERKVPLFFEIRPKMKRHQVALLAAAGVTEVLPGIESLSDHSLDLMGKATTALEGVQLLKWCTEFGMDVDWTYLHGTPGETPEDHENAEQLVRACRHLPAPQGIVRVQIHRFAPLFQQAEELGFTNVRAEEVYSLLFPFDQETIDRIAYVFDADYLGDNAQALEADGLRAAVLEWVDQGDPSEHGLLWEIDDDTAATAANGDGSSEGAGELWLVDDRTWTTPTGPLPLKGWRAAVYRRCDRIAERHELVALALQTGATEDQLASFLAWCVERDYLANDGDRYVGLAVHHPPRWPSRDALRPRRSISLVETS